ncbi:hypothetical protein HZS_2062 [Henneguya salminicola]|nr:hypothetical protein HZS_2062 [Henneguya salminicola]
MPFSGGTRSELYKYRRNNPLLDIIVTSFILIFYVLFCICNDKKLSKYVFEQRFIAFLFLNQNFT